jgi:hypothetical protein
MRRRERRKEGRQTAVAIISIFWCSGNEREGETEKCRQRERRKRREGRERKGEERKHVYITTTKRAGGQDDGN